MCYEHYRTLRDAPDKSRLATPRKLLLFLNRLATRHVSEYGAIARGLETMAKGEQAELHLAHTPDDKMKLVAHILCTLGQEDADARASFAAKVCTIAIEGATDKDNETCVQLAEALEILALDEVTGPAPPPDYDIEALRAQFVGSAVEIEEKNNMTFYTFRGRAAYPAELTIGADKYRLCNASYRKGIYQKVSPAAKAAEPSQATEYAV